MLWFGTVGSEIELLLLKHTDGALQLIPLALNSMTLVVLVWYAAGRNAASLRALQTIMALCLISGAVGVILHFRANVAYASDSNPSLSGAELYKEALLGATPSLAPGTMIQLALLGLAFAFRHPVLRDAARSKEITSTTTNQ